MRTITVKKGDLLRTVLYNRDKHAQTFQDAMEVYREQMIAELDRMIQEAKKGSKIRRAFALPEPEEHTADYDRVIQMLQMEVKDEVELDEIQFAQYVQDEWGWQRSFLANTSSYTSAKN